MKPETTSISNKKGKTLSKRTIFFSAVLIFSRMDERKQECLGVFHPSGVEVHRLNDEVNFSQSSNCNYPTALHIAAVTIIEDKLLSSVLTSEEFNLELNHEIIEMNLNNSLMLVTVLNPHIGYEKRFVTARNSSILCKK